MSSSTAVGHHLPKKRTVRKAHGCFTVACRPAIRKEALELVWLTLGGQEHYCFSAYFDAMRVCLETRSTSACVFVRVGLCECVLVRVRKCVCVCEGVRRCAKASSLEISNRLQVL